MRFLIVGVALCASVPALAQSPTGPGPVPASPVRSEAAPPDRQPGERGPGGRGAHFRLRMGGSSLDVRCAADEPMRACADIVTSLLDKITTSARAGGERQRGEEMRRGGGDGMRRGSGDGMRRGAAGEDDGDE